MTALAGWQNFCVIVGSSAGALIGLQFVGMSLIANMPTALVNAQAGGAFATPTIIHFGTVLLLTGILSAPWDGIGAPTVLWVSGTQRPGVRSDHHPASATPNRVPCPIRGLVISCSAALRGLCIFGCIALRRSASYARGSFCDRSSGATASFHRYS